VSSLYDIRILSFSSAFTLITECIKVSSLYDIRFFFVYDFLEIFLWLFASFL
jgi:hypothetical protein